MVDYAPCMYVIEFAKGDSETRALFTYSGIMVIFSVDLNKDSVCSWRIIHLAAS